MDKNITFFNLITENEIEIPIIQRDYAQGRIENRINYLRKKFITALLSALQEDYQDNLHLGFIYGKIEGKDQQILKERNKEAIERVLNAVNHYALHLNLDIAWEMKQISKDKIKEEEILPQFIPLDGQQRLTTLFLLHYYLAYYTNDFESKLKVLQHFKYKTRKSSLEFCTALTNPKNKLNETKFSEYKISDMIKDTTWCYTIWKYDPTVRSMLTMLDEIQRQISEQKNHFSMSQILFNEKRIVFDFLDLDKLQQTDKLYVKMNARGKQLTEFEHFKAWLQKYIKDNDSISKAISDENWDKKIDKAWMDLIWKNNENVYDIDDLLYFAFKQITLLEYISEKTTDKIDQSFIQSIRNKESFISFEEYEKNDFFNAKTLNFTFNIFELLASESNMMKFSEWLSSISISPFVQTNSDLTKYFISSVEKSNVNMPETVFYYAFILFAIDTNNLDDHSTKTNFKNWMRISRNLIFNTNIQNPSNFIEAIKSIKNLSEFKGRIYDYICSSNVELKFFNTHQRSQEQIKAELLQNDVDKWGNKILEYENHDYFFGDIDFLLRFSLENGIYSYEKFVFYGDRASVLFNDGIRNHTDWLLNRLILSEGTYFPCKGGRIFTICLPNNGTLRDRRENWRLFLNNEDKSVILKKLIRRNFEEIKDINDANITRIIKGTERYNWEKYFLDYPYTFKYCSQGFFRIDSVNYITLLNQSQLNHYHTELRIFALYLHLEQKKKMNLHKFNPVKKTNALASFKLDDQNKTYQIIFDYHKNKFHYKITNPISEENFKEVNYEFPYYDEVKSFDTYIKNDENDIESINE